MFIKKYKFLYIILIVTLLFTVSCKSEENKDKKQGDKEQIPQQLKNIQETSEEIIGDVEKLQADLESPARAMEELQKGKEGEQSKQDSGNKQDSQNQQGQKEEDKQKEGEDTKDQEKQKEEDKEKKMEEFQKEVDKTWVDIGKKIKDIHSGWNNFEPKSIEDGAGQEDIKRFKDALNGLTIAVQNHNILDTLTMSNEVTLFTARFLDFYKGNIDNEMLRIKYFIRKSWLDAMKDDWEGVKEDMKGTGPVFEKIKTKIKLKEKDKELIEKLQLSLTDMQTVIDEKNTQLLKIKRDIVLNNLKELKSAEQ